MRSGRLVPGVVVRALAKTAGTDGVSEPGATGGMNSPGNGGTGRGVGAALADVIPVRAGVV